MLTYSPFTSSLRLKSYTDPANLHPVQGYNSDRFVVWKIQLEIARDPDFFLGESKEKEEEEEEEEEKFPSCKSNFPFDGAFYNL